MLLQNQLVLVPGYLPCSEHKGGFFWVFFFLVTVQCACTYRRLKPSNSTQPDRVIKLLGAFVSCQVSLEVFFALAVSLSVHSLELQLRCRAARGG